MGLILSYFLPIWQQP